MNLPQAIAIVKEHIRIGKGMELTNGVPEALEMVMCELNRLQVALEATIKEKEKYKRAFEEICHQFNYGDDKDYQAMHDAFLELAKEGGNDDTERTSETP